MTLPLLDKTKFHAVSVKSCPLSSVGSVTSSFTKVCVLFYEGFSHFPTSSPDFEVSMRVLQWFYR